MRTSRMSMLYGTTTFDIPAKGLLHIQRTYMEEVTDIYLNRTNANLELPGAVEQPWVALAGSLTGGRFVPPFGAVALGQPSKTD